MVVENQTDLQVQEMQLRQIAYTCLAGAFAGMPQGSAPLVIAQNGRGLPDDIIQSLKMSPERSRWVYACTRRFDFSGWTPEQMRLFAENFVQTLDDNPILEVLMREHTQNFPDARLNVVIDPTEKLFTEGKAAAFQRVISREQKISGIFFPDTDAFHAFWHELNHDKQFLQGWNNLDLVLQNYAMEIESQAISFVTEPNSVNAGPRALVQDMFENAANDYPQEYDDFLKNNHERLKRLGIPCEKNNPFTQKLFSQNMQMSLVMDMYLARTPERMEEIMRARKFHPNTIRNVVNYLQRDVYRWHSSYADQLMRWGGVQRTDFNKSFDPEQVKKINEYFSKRYGTRFDFKDIGTAYEFAQEQQDYQLRDYYEDRVEEALQERKQNAQKITDMKAYVDEKINAGEVEWFSRPISGDVRDGVVGETVHGTVVKEGDKIIEGKIVSAEAFKANYFTDESGKCFKKQRFVRVMADIQFASYVGDEKGLSIMSDNVSAFKGDYLYIDDSGFVNIEPSRGRFYLHTENGAPRTCKIFDANEFQMMIMQDRCYGLDKETGELRSFYQVDRDIEFQNQNGTVYRIKKGDTFYYTKEGTLKHLSPDVFDEHFIPCDSNGQLHNGQHMAADMSRASVETETGAAKKEPTKLGENRAAQRVVNADLSPARRVQLEAEFFKALDGSDPSQVVDLLKQLDDPNIKLPNGEPAFFKMDTDSCIRAFVDAGVDVDIKNLNGNTMLHDLAMTNRSNLARYLLEHGADVNIPNPDGVTPAHLAALWGEEDMLKLLVEHGADLSAKDNQGRTVLDYAKHNQNVYPDVNRHRPVNDNVVQFTEEQMRLQAAADNGRTPNAIHLGDTPNTSTTPDAGATPDGAGHPEPLGRGRTPTRVRASGNAAFAGSTFSASALRRANAGSLPDDGKGVVPIHMGKWGKIIAGGGAVMDGIEFGRQCMDGTVSFEDKAITGAKTIIYMTPAWPAALLNDIIGTEDRVKFQITTKEGQEKAQEILEGAGMPAGLSRRYVTDLSNTMNREIYVEGERATTNSRRFAASFGFTPAFNEYYERVKANPQEYLEKGLAEGNFFTVSEAMRTEQVTIDVHHLDEPLRQGDADMVYLLASHNRLPYTKEQIKSAFQMARGIDTMVDVPLTMLNNCSRQMDGAELDEIVEGSLMSRRDGSGDTRLTPQRLYGLMARYQKDGQQMSGQTFCKIMGEIKEHTASADLGRILTKQGLNYVEITPEVVAAVREAPASIRDELIAHLKATPACQQNPELLDGLRGTADRLADGEEVGPETIVATAEANRAPLRHGTVNTDPRADWNHSAESRQAIAAQHRDVLEERVYLANGDNLRLIYESEEAYRAHRPSTLQYNALTTSNLSDDVRNQYAIQDTTQYSAEIPADNIVSWDDEKGWVLTDEGRTLCESEILPYNRRNVEVYSDVTRMGTMRTTTGVGQTGDGVDNTQVRTTQNADGTYTVGYPSRQVLTTGAHSIGYEEFIYDENHQRIDAYQVDDPAHTDPENPAARYVTYDDSGNRHHTTWTRAPRQAAWAREEQLKRMAADPENAFYGAMRTGDVEAQDYLLERDPSLLVRPLTFKQNGQDKHGIVINSVTKSLLQQPTMEGDRRMQLFRAGVSQLTDPEQIQMIGQAIGKDAFSKIAADPAFLETPQGQTHLAMLKELLEKHPEQRDAILSVLPKDNPETKKLLEALGNNNNNGTLVQSGLDITAERENAQTDACSNGIMR